MKPAKHLSAKVRFTADFLVETFRRPAWDLEWNEI